MGFDIVLEKMLFRSDVYRYKTHGFLREKPGPSWKIVAKLGVRLTAKYFGETDFTHLTQDSTQDNDCW